MDKKILDEIRISYCENPEVAALYEDWGNSAYLQEIFELLTKRSKDWNLEKELGSWASEFIAELLEANLDEFSSMNNEKRLKYFQELIDEQYDDIVRSHQLSRFNVAMGDVRLRDLVESDLIGYLHDEGQKVGFPIVETNIN